MSCGSPFHLLVKPTGAICNLDCDYCYFLSRERLYPGSRFRMAEGLMERYVRELVRAHRESPTVTFAWQGGEPTLMGLDFYRRFVEVARASLLPGQQAEFTIQTNATLLDETWAAFLADNGFLVGVSIDGPRELHDRFRVNKGGRGTFDAVMRGLDCLRSAGVDWNALTTVNAANDTTGREIYRFLRDECAARHIQFIPIVEATADSGLVTERSTSGERYGNFLVEVFDEWVHRDVGRVFVQMFDVALANWLGVEPGLCVHAETCGRALALEHTGDVYCCDHFVDADHLLGNIRDTSLAHLVESPRQRRFGDGKREGLPAMCRDCDVRFACHGGCPKDRLLITPDGEAGLNYLCDGFQHFFHHIDQPMRRMAGLLRQGRPPADIMRELAAASPSPA